MTDLDVDLTPRRARPVLLAVDLDPDDLAAWWSARAAALTRGQLGRRDRRPTAPCAVCGHPSVAGAHRPCVAAVAS